MSEPKAGGAFRERPVVIPAGDRRLDALLSVPENARGVVAFAHGSGSGRLSPRNRSVAETLNADGFATLLLDLLEESEAQDRARVFDVALLSGRLRASADWLAAEPATHGLPLGYFGASTGAAAALLAASGERPGVAAVVSRGGRPDLAGDALATVRVPTLLIVGGLDTQVLGLNRGALERLAGPKSLAVVPGATHLFAEPGALEDVARMATSWFSKHLAAHDPGRSP